MLSKSIASLAVVRGDLCSALYATEPPCVSSKLRARGKRIAGKLREQDEPTSLAEFTDQVGRMRKMPLSLSKVKSSVLLSCTTRATSVHITLATSVRNAQLVRIRLFRERALLEWVFDKDRIGIYIMQVVDSMGYSGHVVTIDANRRLVYDSFLQHPLQMDENGITILAETVMFFCCGGRISCRGVRNVYKLTQWNEKVF